MIAGAWHVEFSPASEMGIDRDGGDQESPSQEEPCHIACKNE